MEEAVIDGEVVAEGGGDAPDFSALQDALATGATERLVFYAFDMLYLDGYDLPPVAADGAQSRVGGDHHEARRCALQ